MRLKLLRFLHVMHLQNKTMNRLRGRTCWLEPVLFAQPLISNSTASQVKHSKFGFHTFTSADICIYSNTIDSNTIVTDLFDRK